MERILRTICALEFLIGKKQRVLTPAASGVDELRADAALARARRTGDEHAAAAKDALAAEHLVEPLDAGGDARHGGFVIELQRRDRQDREAVLADEEGVFVRAVSRAAILHHAQAPGANLLGDALVENNHAIGHIFFQPVPRDRRLALFAGNDGRHAAILQPAEQPAQLRAQDGVIWQSGEQRLDRVEHDAFRADGIDGVAETDEEPFEIVLAGLLDLAAFDMDVIEQDHFLRGELVQIEAERADVGCEFGGVFLEHHEHARLAELCRTAHEEFHGEHRLAAPRGAADERGPPRRQTAAGDLVKALNAGGGLGQCGRTFRQFSLSYRFAI